MPSFATVPTRKFSISTSARSARRKKISFPSGCFRSMTTLRLLRLRLTKYAESLPRKGGPQAREMSPVGGSILRTFAPLSPSQVEAKGPASACERSRTSRSSSAMAIGRVLLAARIPAAVRISCGKLPAPIDDDYPSGIHLHPYEHERSDRRASAPARQFKLFSRASVPLRNLRPPRVGAGRDDVRKRRPPRTALSPLRTDHLRALPAAPEGRRCRRGRHTGDIPPRAAPHRKSSGRRRGADLDLPDRHEPLLQRPARRAQTACERRRATPAGEPRGEPRQPRFRRADAPAHSPSDGGGRVAAPRGWIATRRGGSGPGNLPADGGEPARRFQSQHAAARHPGVAHGSSLLTDARRPGARKSRCRFFPARPRPSRDVCEVRGGPRHPARIARAFRRQRL